MAAAGGDLNSCRVAAVGVVIVVDQCHRSILNGRERENGREYKERE